ncbi:MAG TPA: hypothetical protein VF173_27570 [Thermoanaerobaculia bacterium]|nr:hypothetical protein [Thermoanaerobaculia bacterium]
MPRKAELEQAVRDALQPLSDEFDVEFEYPDGRFGSGYRVGFAIADLVDEEGAERREIYRAPYWRYSAAGMEAWIEAERQNVVAAVSRWRDSNA